MADTIANCPTNSTNFKEAVCINADRVYDSCCDRDCLEDLRVYFNAADQQLISDAQYVRLKGAEVVYTNIDVEPVNFHKGYYTCTLNIYFMVSVDISGATLPNTTVSGIAYHQKQIVLYGSEGSVKVFSNTYTLSSDADTQSSSKVNTPKCTVQVAEPVLLSARLYKRGTLGCCLASFPQCVQNCICGGLCDTEPENNSVYVTIGLFSIVSLAREVQILVPTYDFAFPEKKCIETNDSPCDVFKSIDFPTNEFFPTRPCNLQGDCGCN